ncbi:Pectin lyase-like superfamily protein [Quillaja saponaria]|uniref:Pectin lyase-like superfamily protein n=1 Tax=Quillaja saponaria TaxID=32244 RepID=A0AAD7LBQ9_QUISA|nr:Pectin lyase-like superfamily protein [Quillaja saponaria]
MLYLPQGNWLTGSFNLTSHLTLFLEKGATILASQDPTHWGVVEPLPSYGRGIELPGGRYMSLINGYKLHDVVITGNNGTIDGRVSNLTLLNAPAYSIHPVYCSNVNIQNITASAPAESPYTVGIVPDSSDIVCIEDSSIIMGYDAISLKSGWDEYGIAYGRPTRNVHIRRMHLQSSSGSSIAFGSYMSGGISDVLVEQVHMYNSHSGVEFRTTKGRGGYIKEIFVSDVEMENIYMAFAATGQCGSHPDDKFDPNALPHLNHIILQDVIGKNITVAGSFTGIQESPFTDICLSNITLSINSVSPTSWVCSNVSGSSDSVFPEPCPDLSGSSNSSSSCFSSMSINGKAAAL